MIKSTTFACLIFIITCVDANKPNITSITLSPHLTELVFSAGGKDSLIGISAYSNYPEATKNLPIIGDAFRLDFEMIKSLQPDLIFYWRNGTANQVIQQLDELGFKLHEISINQLSDIPSAIENIANALKTTPLEAPKLFTQRLDQLKSHRLKQKTALIQISDKPIYTVNGLHWMSEAIAVCGLSNVYAELSALSAAVTLESVVLNKPEVLVRLEPLANENQLASWKSIPAVKNQHIAVLEADHFTRPTLRTLLAIESLCEQVEAF
ncbi:ABC transporter substrate-binding protein [Marinicella litoralis]|uniref:Iron complex transport system substrate-binding protein/vitamin B12 transport system substrate-binding protein n=1 Tax=Marinicella litoralis TaxID=644220 RepID=A0A4R6XSV1_9GAMM|nr:ABC transporter substrate-binding protein [Marinicella litoralis]TDR19428.1 iron complex transport system substrate-binding protein/vitamin B12 transport system substrate-binding protein [Marinicella litoralis]